MKLFDRDDYDYIMGGRVSNTIHITSRDGYHFSAKELVMNHDDYPADMSCHIRDPKVYKEGEFYYMVLGARDVHSKGMVLLYRSKDLKNGSILIELLRTKTLAICGNVRICSPWTGSSVWSAVPRA